MITYLKLFFKTNSREVRLNKDSAKLRNRSNLSKMVVFAKLRKAFGLLLFIILLVTLLDYIAILLDSNDQEVAGHFLS